MAEFLSVPEVCFFLAPIRIVSLFYLTLVPGLLESFMGHYCFQEIKVVFQVSTVHAYDFNIYII